MKYKVIGIGEVLWDILPSGRKMGGAPANFACHALALGADACVVSRVGDDALGCEILDRLESLGLSTHFVGVDDQYATGTAQVAIGQDGQPRFTIKEGVAWDHLTITSSLIGLFAGADAICFGSLAQRSQPSRIAIRSLVSHSPAVSVRVFDVNLRQNFYTKELIEDSLKLANVLKLNDVELPKVSALLGIKGTPKDQLATLLDRYEIGVAACTLGANGSILYDGKIWSESSACKSEVKDTVGAGDSFTATLVLGLLAGWAIEEIGEFANEVAAYVCSCEGATPSMPDALRSRFQSEASSLRCA